jgi:hypothetical protein
MNRKFDYHNAKPKPKPAPQEKEKKYKMGLKMKYFVLNPHSKVKNDPFAKASRAAMQAYAESIREHDSDLFDDLKCWVVNEVTAEVLRFGD